jgi:short chain dehydrogenase
MANKINKTKVAIVTGSSSGIGFETSLLLARNGFFTYATMRNLDTSNKIIELKQKESLPLEVLKLDVTDDKSVNDAIGKIANEQETIDVLTEMRDRRNVPDWDKLSTYDQGDLLQSVFVAREMFVELESQNHFPH